MPTVSWVFEIKHSVGFQRGSPARPGLGDRRVTTPPPLSPLTGHRSFVHRRGALAHHFADRFCHFDSSWSSAHQNSTISQQHISVLRIARGSLHACVLLAFTRGHQGVRRVPCGPPSSAMSTQTGALLIRTPSFHSTSRGSLHACVLLALTHAHQIDRPVRCRTSWPDRLSSA